MKAGYKVRRTCDAHAEMLTENASAKVMEFFTKAGEAARNEAERERSAQLDKQPWNE